MKKTIKITAIIAFALQALYALVGKFIVPIVSGIIYSNRSLSYSSEPVVTLLVGMGAYFVVAIIGLIVPLLYLGFMFALISASKSEKTGIALEVLGICLFGLALPLITELIRIPALPLISRVTTNLGSVDSFSIFNIMSASGGYLSVLGTVSLVLIIISFTVSLCRKKWGSDDEFEQGTEE